MGQITVQPSKLYVMQDVNWPNGGFTDGNTDLLPLSGERSIGTFQDYDSVNDVYYDVHFNILAEYAPSLPANITITGVTLNIFTGNSHLTNNPNFTFNPTVFSTPSVPGTINPSAYVDTGSQLGQTSFTASQGAPNRWVAISCLGLKDNGWRFRFNSSGGSDLYFQSGSAAGKNPYLVIDYVENNVAPNAPSVSISGIGSDYQPTSGTNYTVNWSINDPDAGDYQTSYQVVGSYNDFATWHTDSGRIYDGNARSYTVNTSQAEGDWRFVVMTWDKNGASSPWGYSVHARVDRTAPAIGSIDGVSNHTSTGAVRKHLYNVTDGFSGVSYADAYWNKNGGAWNGPYRANVWDNGQPGTDFWYDFPGNQGDGTINVRYWVYDAAGNGSYRDTSYNIDTTPPTAPTINRSRGDVWGNTDVTFTITNGTDNFSGVNRSEYQLNGGAWTTYTGTVTISSEGTTTISARTIDNYGNVSGTTTNYAYIDKTAPANANPTVSGGTYRNSSSVTINWSAFSDPAPSSGYQWTAIHLQKWNGSAWADVAVPLPAADGTNYKFTDNRTTYTLTGLADGQYQFLIAQRDNANTYGPWSWIPFTVDTVKPNDPITVVSSIKSTSAVVTWNAFSDPAPSSGWGSTLIYIESWNGSAFQGLSGSPFSIGNVTSYNISGLTAGARYRTVVVHTDVASNFGNYTWKEFYANNLPVASITSPTNGSYKNTQRPIISVVGNDAEGSTVELRIEISKVSDFSTKLADSWATHTGELGYAGWATKGTVASGVANNYTPQVDLGEGTVYVRATAWDATAGESGPTSSVYSFIVDVTVPTIASVQGYSYTNLTSGTRRIWAYGVSDGISGINNVNAQYLPPGGSWQGPFTCIQSGSDWYYDVPISATQGEWRVDFYAYDRAGNISNNNNPAISYFFIDSVRANDPNPGAVWGETTVTISWSQFIDPSPSSGRRTTDFYLGEWDGSAYVGTPLFLGADIGDVTSKLVTGLKKGTRYRYTVTYHDTSGNESAYTYREFVTKKKIGEQLIKGANGIIVLPIYDPNSGVLGSKAISIKTTVGIGCFELVPITDINSSPVYISTLLGIRSISK